MHAHQTWSLKDEMFALNCSFGISKFLPQIIVFSDSVFINNC
jgi:hypothetical protein